MIFIYSPTEQQMYKIPLTNQRISNKYTNSVIN